MVFTIFEVAGHSAGWLIRLSEQIEPSEFD